MTHSVIGNVTNELYNTTVDKTLTVNRLLSVGTLVVVYSAGYSNGTPSFVGISDSSGNSWDHEFVEVASGYKWLLICWSSLTHALEAGDSISLNMSSPTPQRSYAIARAFTGLLGDEHDVSSNYNGFSSNFPAAADSVAVGSDGGRFCGIVFYPTEYFDTDYWENGISQVKNLFSTTNVDTFSIGEKIMTPSSSVIPEHNIHLSSQWIIMGVTFEEGTPASGLVRATRTVWF